MKAKLLFLSFSIFLITTVSSCKNEPQHEKVEENHQQKKIPSIIENYNFTETYDQENYSLTIQSNNEIISKVGIFTNGLEHDYKTTFEIEGRVLNSYKTDLNNDGFYEFFLEIIATDDSGNMELLGFASNGDKSISTITIRETNELKERNTDKLDISKNQILRTFRANGEDITYKYNLVENKGGYILELEKL